MIKKIKYGAYIINCDGEDKVGTHWIPVDVDNDKVKYFDRFSVEYIPKGIKNIHVIKALKEIYTEFKYMIQQYVNTSALD